MLDVDLAAMRRLVDGLDYKPLFVTVSGAPSTASRRRTATWICGAVICCRCATW